MKGMRLTATLALALAAILAPSAAAQLKVAVVNTVQAIQQSEEAKDFMAKVQEELASEQTDLQALQDEVVGLQQRLQDEGDVMAEADRRAVNKDIENKRLDLEFRAQKLQKEVQDRQEELLGNVGPKVQTVVNDLVEVERYDFVFERRNVGYVNPRHDITAKVTEKLNERYEEDKAAGDG